MRSLLWFSFLAFGITWIIFPVIVYIAKKFNIVDNPSARKLQKEPVPVFGGVAVALGVFIPLIFAASVFHVQHLWYEIVVMVCLLLIGIIDDIRTVPAWMRFVLEMILVWFLLWRTHFVINDLHGLWGINVVTVYSALPLSIVAGVGIINSINLIDGVDGYSSGYGIFANMIFVIVFCYYGEPELSYLSATCAAALLPFFLHNVFGRTSDGGSLFIGMVMVCNIFALLSEKSHTGELMQNDGVGVVAFTLAVLCVPVFDTLRVMFARIIMQRSPFWPDKTHLHHMFIRLGFSHVGTSISIILTNCVIVLLWYCSYTLGCSYDVQLYIVCFMGLLSTCGFYYGMEFCCRRENGLYRIMRRVGRWTHFEQNGFWHIMERVVDFPEISVRRDNKTCK